MGRSLLKLLYAVLAPILALVWLMQSSVNTYWQESYHREPLAPMLQETRWWQLGGQIQQLWTVRQGAWTESIADFDKKSMAAINQVWYADPVVSRETPDIAEAIALAHAEPVLAAEPMHAPPAIPALAPEPTAEPVSEPTAEVTPDPPAAPTETLLQKGDKVLFVGDSLMQGVAPHVRKALFKQYGIEGIDLSKQSTGLAYSGFFNWPKTVAATFVQHPDLKLMVVFLGPNDPWDFPLNKGQPYVRFKSPEWEGAYRERIQAMLNTARAHGARVVWLGVPTMKKKKLNEGMTYLNSLYESEVLRMGGLFLPTSGVLGSDGLEFAAYAQVNNKKIKVRLDDGIHFTLPGQRLIADTVLTHIRVASSE